MPSSYRENKKNKKREGHLINVIAAKDPRFSCASFNISQVVQASFQVSQDIFKARFMLWFCREHLSYCALQCVRCIRRQLETSLIEDSQCECQLTVEVDVRLDRAGLGGGGVLGGRLGGGVDLGEGRLRILKDE